MLVQAAQGAKDAYVIGIIRLQLEPETLGDRQRDLQDIDRIEPEAFPIQRRRRVDLVGGALQVERFDDQLRQLALLWRQRLRDAHLLASPSWRACLDSTIGGP